jgi:predicted phage baseplate assembly protein
MPLQNALPIIDDRTYQEIVEEARSRIPRYTPEWTDVNETDPGMIMVELFAWLTEMQLYRMSKVPALNYIKFLQLIGIELEPAKPATAHMTFPVSGTYAEPYTIVPALTQVTTENPDDQGPIIFETDQALIAIKAALLSLQAYDGLNYRNISQENGDIEAVFEPFGPLANEESAVLLGFDDELPNVTIGLQFWVPNASSSGIAVTQCLDQSQRLFVFSELQWEYWNGREWQNLTLLKDDTGRLTRSGTVQFKGPGNGAMVAAAIGKVADNRYWIRARVTKAGYESAPRILAVRTNTISATQAETIQFEIVGGSNGQVNQVVQLGDSPVIDGSLQLQVDEGGGYETWTEVPDFFGSSLNDSHYVLNRATGEIRFGDGTAGRVPVANPRTPANIRALAYRVGGGRRGNVAAGSLVVLQSHVDGIDADAVSNLFAAAGGAEEETIDEAKKRAPQTLKSRERAVTNEDFEELAVRSTNIARAKALPLHHPRFPGVEVPGVVTVIVVPDIDDPAPTPSESTLNAVCVYLNARRLLTTEVFVIGPTYREVTIHAELIVNDNADLAEVKETALDSLERYFDPIKGGEESSTDDPGAGWPFGGDIYYSLLYRRLLQEGIKRIASLTVTLDGDTYPPCQDVAVAAGALLANGDHDIQVGYEVAN